MTYKDHWGLLRCTPDENAMEIFSDSHWAKHHATKKSASSGHVYPFGNLLYASSRAQKPIALNSAEAEVYAAVSASCDGTLLHHCIQVIAGDGVTVRFTLNPDNSAGRAFLCRSGWGAIVRKLF